MGGEGHRALNIRLADFHQVQGENGIQELFYNQRNCSHESPSCPISLGLVRCSFEAYSTATLSPLCWKELKSSFTRVRISITGLLCQNLLLIQRKTDPTLTAGNNVWSKTCFLKGSSKITNKTQCLVKQMREQKEDCYQNKNLSCLSSQYKE